MNDKRFVAKTLCVMLLLAAICVPVYAAMLVTDDFESTAWNANWAGTNWLTRVAAPAPGHGSFSLSMTNPNQRITRGKDGTGAALSIPAGSPFAVRFWFFDQSGAKGNFAAISTEANAQAFGLGNKSGGDYMDFEMVSPMAWWGNDIWSNTILPRTYGVWRRCDIFYNGATVAKYLVDGAEAGSEIPAVIPLTATAPAVPPPFTKVVVGIGGPSETVSTSYIDDLCVFNSPARLTLGVTPDSVGFGRVVTGTPDAPNLTSLATSGYYDTTEHLSLWPIPIPGYQFSCWVENGNVIDGFNLTPFTFDDEGDVTGNRAIPDGLSWLAKFELEPGKVGLTLKASPGGAGTTTGTGGYDPGSHVSASAAGAAGYSFSKWSTAADGSDTVSTANPYNFTMGSASLTLFAIFTPNNYTLTLNANANGTIDPSSASGTKAFGSSCTIKAVPDIGKAFNGWSTDAAGANVISRLATYTFNMPAQNYTLYANFTVQQKFNFTDGFENRAVTYLDSNFSGTANSGGNGTLTGNPWWGTKPWNASVYNTIATSNSGFVITPHSGARMVAGRPGNGLNYINAAYRANGGNALSGNFVADWWFYDYFGAAGKFADRTGHNQYEADAVSLCNFVGIAPGAHPTPPGPVDDTIALGKDYPTSASSENFPEDHFAQKLGLGCSKDVSTGFDKTLYQGRIKGATGIAGQYGTNGWINLPRTRTQGWHHGRIFVGPQKANLHNDVSFYIDDMVVPLLTSDSFSPASYNLLEITMQMTATGYTTNQYSECVPVDDFTFASIPAVASLIVDPADHINTPTTRVTWDSIGAVSFKLQVDSGAWVSATSPYTLDVSGLSYGTHSVSVKGIDASSNEGMPASATFSVDKTSIKTWLISGHFPYDVTPPVTTGSKRYSNDFFAPDSSELTIAPVAGQTNNGKTWFAYTSPGQAVDFNSAGVYNTPTTFTQYGVSYVFTYIKNTGTTTINDAWVTCGSDDGIKVFANGAFVGGTDLYRGLTVDGDTYGPITLTPGLNKLLLKITQGTSGYQVQARLTQAAKAYPTWINQISYTLVPEEEVPDIKSLFGKADGGTYKLTGQCVTMAANGAFWIESADRTCAMKVICTGALPTPGHSVTFSGTLSVVGTQRVMTTSGTTDIGVFTPAVTALGVVEKAVGGKSAAGKPSITDGVGVFNVGMYVRVAGNVVPGSVVTSAPKSFLLDDGSGLGGIKVVCGSIDPPASGAVIVTGAVGTALDGTKTVPVLDLASWRTP